MIGGIDLFSPSSYASGHPTDQYAWLRDNDPVHWHEEPGGPGFWAVTRHEDVKAVSRNAALFSSRPTIMIDDGAAMDLGDHTMMLTTALGGSLWQTRRGRMQRSATSSTTA